MEKAYRIKDRLQLHSRILHCKREQLWLFLECIACTGLLFSVCFNNNVWPDEAFSFDMAAHYSVMDIIIRTAGDVHPPFYYLLAHMFVILFGKKLIVLKAVSVLAAAGCMLLSATVVYRRFGLKTAAAMIFLSAFAPQMAFFGVQLRMYSWAAFFCLWNWSICL